MNRKKIFFDNDYALTFDSFVKELNKMYSILNTNNLDFLNDKYVKYLDLYGKYKSKEITLLSRFDMRLLGFEPIMSNKSIDFYINRGYSISEGSELISKLQKTLSIEKIQKKYSLSYYDAIIKRKVLYDDIHTKMNNTFNSKYSDVEIKNINLKKGSSLRYDYFLDKINPITGIFYTIDEAKLQLKKRQSIGSASRKENNKINHNYKIQYNTTLEYWMQYADNDIEKAYKLLIDRQSTFTLEKCILKYGEIEGTKKFYDRQSKWVEKMKNKTIEEKTSIALKKFRNNNVRFYSNESVKYFDIIIKELNLDLIYLYKDSEIFLNIDDKIYFYDFCIPELKIIIEYNGSHVHPSLLLTEDEKNVWKHPYSKDNYYETIKKETLKKYCALNNNYKYYVIYDYEKFDKLNFILKEIKNEFYRTRDVE